MRVCVCTSSLAGSSTIETLPELVLKLRSARSQGSISEGGGPDSHSNQSVNMSSTVRIIFWYPVLLNCLLVKGGLLTIGFHAAKVGGSEGPTQKERQRELERARERERERERETCFHGCQHWGT